MSDTDQEYQSPRFVIEEDNDPAAVQSLQNLDKAIHADPQTLKHVVHTLGTDGFDPQNRFACDVMLATGTEVDYGFDDVTEKKIAASGIITGIKKQRKDYQQNPTKSAELAAQLRRQRLALYIEQVIEAQILTADNDDMPVHGSRPEGGGAHLST
jgi:hypothetical protein